MNRAVQRREAFQTARRAERRPSRLIRLAASAAAAVVVAAAPGCGEHDADSNQQTDWRDFYASELVSFDPGEGAGFNEEKLPDVVLGAPDGDPGAYAGSMDVLSLGAGGEIVVGFGDREIVDGDGPDFIVYENAFRVAGDTDEVWAELGEVSVSADGETWKSWECDYDPDDDPPYHGCAGWTPTFQFDPQRVVPPDPEITGGDAFDLGELGVDRARYVRIRDVWGKGDEPTRGFDLDAVGAINVSTSTDTHGGNSEGSRSQDSPPSTVSK